MKPAFFDPGVKKGGLAVFCEGVLVYASTLRASTPAGLARLVQDRIEKYGADVLVVEKMQKYAYARSKHKDLDRVEDMVDILKSRVSVRVLRISPFAWKRQVPKKVCEIRVRAILSKGELASMSDTGHDAFDAVGIGLVHIGRAGKGLVPK